MPNWSDLVERLQAGLGHDAVVSGNDSVPTDEIPICAVSTPRDTAKLREIVQLAAEAHCPIYPLGGRTQLSLGMPGRGQGIGVSTLQLDRVIDYPARDMTITVEAGIRMAKVQEVLRAEGQRLPVDVPRATEATLGGAIATNTSGPRRYGLGTLRDYVLGISVVDSQGNETKAGGRVVKNVAGYDLCKLYTGSLGTLGIITQVTLKLRPLPEASAIAWVPLDNAEHAAAALDRLAVSRTRPTAVDLLNSAAAAHVVGQVGLKLPSARWILVLGFEENAEAVQWQLGEARQELHGLSAAIECIAGNEAQRIWDALVEFQALELGPVTFKANYRSSATVEFLETAGRQDVVWAIQAHAGNGIAYGHAVGGASRSVIESALASLRDLASSGRGNLTLRRCPTGWKLSLPVWGEPRGDLWLMQAIKRTLDPDALFNPGRFVDPGLAGSRPV